MRFFTRSFLFGCTLALPAGPALGLEPGTLGGDPVRLDVTNATSATLNVDNRNTRRADVARKADDDWGVWYNRLNAQASWNSWQAGLRLDSALFYTSPDATDVGLDLLAEEHGGELPQRFDDDDARFFLQMVRQADSELSNKYINWVYPSKYYVGYNTPEVEATAGDFYAQFGRGLVLSVRKLDELASDTTVRGGRVTGRIRAGEVRLKLTALGGSLNPLRIDEASGRYLSVDGRVTGTFGTITEAGMPRPIDSAFIRDPFPTYSPDRVVGFQLEGGTSAAQVGVQAALLDRHLVDLDDDGTDEALSPGVSRSAKRIGTGSLSLNVPDVAERGAGYLEVAVQQPTYPDALEAADDARPENARILPGTGHALYGSVNFHESPVAVTVEGKHYRRFFPLQANVNINTAREFGVLQYSSPPTTEAFWIDTEFEGFNTCVSGGRAKTDFELGSDESVFVWVGRYATWNESIANERCRTSDDNLNRVWDFATGLEVTSQARKSRANVTFGSRFDDAHRELTDPLSGEATHVFYREVYVRYDVIRHLHGPYSLQLQGWHRRRRQTLGGPNESWNEGQHLTSVTWLPRWTVGFGVEYDENPQFPSLYFNGQVTYKIDSASNVSIFAGQRRGGLRCVAGVCRIFPPFEGVRGDVTLRF